MLLFPPVRITGRSNAFHFRNDCGADLTYQLCKRKVVWTIGTLQAITEAWSTEEPSTQTADKVDKININHPQAAEDLLLQTIREKDPEIKVVGFGSMRSGLAENNPSRK